MYSKKFYIFTWQLARCELRFNRYFVQRCSSKTSWTRCESTRQSRSSTSTCCTPRGSSTTRSKRGSCWRPRSAGSSLAASPRSSRGATTGLAVDLPACSRPSTWGTRLGSTTTWKRFGRRWRKWSRSKSHTEESDFSASTTWMTWVMSTFVLPYPFGLWVERW